MVHDLAAQVSAGSLLEIQTLWFSSKPQESPEKHLSIWPSSNLEVSYSVVLGQGLCLGTSGLDDLSRAYKLESLSISASSPGWAMP